MERAWAPRSEAEKRGDAQTGWPSAGVNKHAQRRAHYVWDSADVWHREGAFCGVRALLVLREGSWAHGNWEVLDEAIPPTESDFG